MGTAVLTDHFPQDLYAPCQLTVDASASTFTNDWRLSSPMWYVTKDGDLVTLRPGKVDDSQYFVTSIQAALSVYEPGLHTLHLCLRELIDGEVVESWVTEDVTVGDIEEDADDIVYVDAAASGSGDGNSAGAGAWTLAQFQDGVTGAAAARWTADGLHLAVFTGVFEDVATSVWNTSANPGYIQFRGVGTTRIESAAATALTAFAKNGANRFSIWNIDGTGPHASWPAAGTENAYFVSAQSPTSHGHNIFLFECDLIGWEIAINAVTSATYAEIASGYADHIGTDRCRFADNREIHVTQTNGRYGGHTNFTMGRWSAAAGQMAFRIGGAHLMRSVYGFTIDATLTQDFSTHSTTDAMRTNCFRVQAGTGSDQAEMSADISIFDGVLLNANEGFELSDGPGAGTAYMIQRLFVDSLYAKRPGDGTELAVGINCLQTIRESVIRNVKLDVDRQPITFGSANGADSDDVMFVHFSYHSIQIGSPPSSLPAGFDCASSLSGLYVRNGAVIAETARRLYRDNSMDVAGLDSDRVFYGQTTGTPTWWGTNNLAAHQAATDDDDNSSEAATIAFDANLDPTAEVLVSASPVYGTPLLVTDFYGHLRSTTQPRPLATEFGATTFPDEPDLAPAAPSDLTAVAASSTSLLVTLTDNSGGTADHDLQYRVSGDSEWTEWSTMQAGDESATITGLSAVTGYDVRARATTEDGSSDWVETTGTTSGNNIGSVTASIIAGSRHNRPSGGRRR